MTAAIEQYKRMLKQHLICDSTTKQWLMDRFDKMLNVYLGDSGWPASWPGMQDLENAFGSPEQMAEILMNEIPACRRAKYRRNRLIIRVIVAVSFAALFTQFIYVLFF